MNLLSGYKTYIAALGMAALGVVDLINGDHDAGVTKLVAALGLLGLRNAMAKV